MKIGVIGYGYVGKAMYKYLSTHYNVIYYDPFVEGSCSKDEINKCKYAFVCVNTPSLESGRCDTSIVEEVINWIESPYICIKSTIEPGTARRLEEQYGLRICHNPEFLSEKTAFEDFDNQEHIVIGINKESKRDADVISLYRDLYPDAKISICKTEESEAMKLFCNNFYAMKVQIFNEFYFLCQKIGADFYEIKDLMLRNDWVNPMHTQVPGGDGEISYGGHCFPKDTKALCHFMKILGSPHGILQACIIERDSMRDKKLE